ncbi:uncharacterized protein PsGEF [Prorops nasuta]|uniref:uncharacterized protein PsGEF n=1 Tax=Prorops nasuta TaxID=863751 RepID=UPI0034CF98D3
MLKWTVSRSLSTSSSTPHAPPNLNRPTSRKPFRDLSNTPPASDNRTRRTVPVSSCDNSASRASNRRKRCRSNGSDVRTYFQATKPNLVRQQQSKRRPLSQEKDEEEEVHVENEGVLESFYQGTPRVDSDIGPLTLYPEASNCSTVAALTLPTDPSLFLKRPFRACNNELPQNIVNEARANLQSHVSDFFKQISMATSPEDVMEAGSVPLAKCRTSYFPKLAKIAKIKKTPYPKTHDQRDPLTFDSPFSYPTSKLSIQQTPLAGKLSNLILDHDLPKFENMDNTVTEVLNREQESNFGGKTVAEILLGDMEEREKILKCSGTRETVRNDLEETRNRIMVIEEERTETNHNDSSVSSASQLLEDPSPMSWAFASPEDDLQGEFTLKRQRGIRRKRQRKDADKAFDGKRMRRRSESFNEGKKSVLDDKTLIEAVNPNVKKLALETDLDSTLDEEKQAKQCKRIGGTPLFNSLESQRTIDCQTRTANTWDLDSPKSSVTDDFYSSKSSFLTSISNTPEAPLVATVRRCLKFSPEGTVEPAAHLLSSRGSIEIEYSLINDHINVRVIRCKDLRRSYDGPIHAYVKASLKNSIGESVVKRTAVHKATPNPVFNETLVLPCPVNNNHCNARATSLDIAVWHRDRRARRSELLGCMTLPLPLSQDKEATWHPLEAGSGRNTSTPYSGIPQDCVVSSPPPAAPPQSSLSKEGEADNNNSGAEDLTYLRHLELEPVDPLTGLPLHPGFTARGGRTPCTVTRRLIRQSAVNQVAWGFSLSWGRPPRVERVDPGSPAERSGLKPGDHVVFVETTNVVTKPREEILGLIQAATSQLILEVYRKMGAHLTTSTSTTIPSTTIPSTTVTRSSLRHRPNSMNVTLQHSIGAISHQPRAVAFSAEVFPNLAVDASPEEELSTRETRYSATLKSGHGRFMQPLAERRDILSAADYMILFQNLDDLLKLSEEIRDEGGGVDSYLSKVTKVIAAYRRYLSGLQRACCLLVALRRNAQFAELVCEPAVPQKRRPDLTGFLLLPLEHYREITRLICLASPRNCQQARDLSQGYREATSNAGIMEPPRDTGKPLLSLQEVESRLVFARCKPFTLALPGRQWLFGGALAKVEKKDGRARLQASWALLLTDLLVFARVSRDRVLFVTEEPLRLSSIAEACFTVRKRPTEFRLQVSINPNGSSENGQLDVTNGSSVGGGGGGCSPHSRPRRRLLVLRAPSPELKAVWHNLLQRQIIYVNTGYGGPLDVLTPEQGSTVDDSYVTARGSNESTQDLEQHQQQQQQQKQQEESTDKESSPDERILKDSRENNHLAQWVRNSHQIPPPDHEGSFEEWTVEELEARAPKECSNVTSPAIEMEENATVNSDVEQQSSTASSASLNTVKSTSVTSKRNGSQTSSKEVSSAGSINICKRCHRSGCLAPAPAVRDPFSPLPPPKISVLPPTPDLCARHHRLKNSFSDSPGRNSPGHTSADGNTEDGSEDDLECDGEPPYRALRRFGTMSSLDQEDELDDQPEEDNRDSESPPTGLRAWTASASNYVVSKVALLEQLSGGYLLHPPLPPERTEYSLEANDEEGTTSGATSGDDIWGTPTSGGPDDDGFTANSPPPNGSTGISGGDNYGLSISVDDGQEDDGESDDWGLEKKSLPELNMEQLLIGGSLGSQRCFLSRRRLAPLPEEEVSPGSGGRNQVGWW